MTIFLLIIITILVLALAYVITFGHVQEKVKNFVNTERSEEKERRKRMVLKHLRTRGTLTNNEAEALLGVSDATATRYFDELEVEGKITQKGEGRGTYYELV